MAFSHINQQQQTMQASSPSFNRVSYSDDAISCLSITLSVSNRVSSCPALFVFSFVAGV